jgi:hypothetical protein
MPVIDNTGAAPRTHSYPPVRAARGEVLDKVARWLSAQEPGKEFGFPEMAEELGLNPASVENVLRRISEHDEPAIEQGYRRGRWRVTGKPLSARVFPDAGQQPAARLAAVPRPAGPSLHTGEVLEVVMFTSAGVPVLKDERGTAWKAVPL